MTRLALQQANRIIEPALAQGKFLPQAGAVLIRSASVEPAGLVAEA